MMRIIDRYGQQNALPLTATKQGTAAKGTPAASQTGTTPQAPAGEKVTLSAKAQELADNAAAADAAKITQLRASIANGTFKVDPRAIANKIVDGNEG
jgi:flagellar biosynthesis anti-sigma factor FlgM